MARIKKPRVGIYSGTFDPVHTGHITFALQAIRTAQLDEVVFLPERIPRRKQAAEHYAHRLAMLKRAVKPYPNMSVLELVDRHFTVKRTWPKLQAIFANAEIALLAGSDVIEHLPDWPNANALLRECELVVGVRAEADLAVIRGAVNTWPVKPRRLHVVPAHAPHVSSTLVRGALAERSHTHGLLSSVKAYSKANWLYVSIEHAINKKI